MRVRVTIVLDIDEETFPTALDGIDREEVEKELSGMVEDYYHDCGVTIKAIKVV